MGIRNLIRGFWRRSADTPQTKGRRFPIITGLELGAVARMATDDQGITALWQFVALHHEHCVQSCDELIKDEPNESLYYGIRGVSLYFERELTRAISDLTEAIRIDPSGRAAHAWHFARGKAYSDAEDLDRAIADLTVATDAGYTSAYSALAFAYLKKGNHQKAIDLISRNIELRPTEAEAFGARGMIHYLQKDYEQAVDDLSKAIELSPDDAEFYAERARCYIEKKQFSHAIADGTSAVKLDPNLMTAHEAIGISLALTGASDKAIDELTKAINLGSKKCFLFRAQHLVEIGERERALADMNEFVSLHECEPQAYCARGSVLSLLGDSDGAIADFSRAIELDRTENQTFCAEAGLRSVLAKQYAARARKHRDEKDDHRAIADYDQAISLATESEGEQLPEWVYWRGMAHLR